MNSEMIWINAFLLLILTLFMCLLDESKKYTIQFVSLFIYIEQNAVIIWIPTFEQI